MIQHYFLVAGEVTFVDGEGNTGIVRMNTVISHTSPNLPLKLLGRANQALSVSVMEELQDATVKVLKITLIAVSPLGQMTEAEFYAGVATDQTKVGETELPN